MIKTICITNVCFNSNFNLLLLVEIIAAENGLRKMEQELMERESEIEVITDFSKKTKIENLPLIVLFVLKNYVTLILPFLQEIRAQYLQAHRLIQREASNLLISQKV